MSKVRVTTVESLDARPVISGTTLRAEGDGWYTIRALETDVAHLYDIGPHPSLPNAWRLAVICVFEESYLPGLVPPGFNFTFPELRASNLAEAVAMKHAIPWWRVHGVQSTPFGTLVLEGAVRTLPTPIQEPYPTLEAPLVLGSAEIHSLIEPCFPFTIAGYDYAAAAEE